MSHQPLVVDADALTILSSNLDLLKNQERDIILTPHMGEFRRLCEFDEHSDMLFVARNFALKHHVILVLKGPYTIVTDGQESYRIFAGNKAMASGGMGDTLAGIITSLLGQGYGGLQAAMLGAVSYTHLNTKVKSTLSLRMSNLYEKLTRDAQKKLDDAKKEYDKGYKTYTESKNTFDSKILEAKIQLINAKITLADKEMEYIKAQSMASSQAQDMLCLLYTSYGINV